MKFLIALSMLLTLSLAQAQTIESHFSPSLEKGRPGQQTTRLFMQNNCYRDVYVAIQHMNVYDQLESRGFWRISPGQVIYLNTIKDRNYLLHGITSDGNISWRGPYNLPLDGRNYPAMLVQLSPERGGDWTTVLYCR
jgi:hypothetical protein